MRNRPLIAMGVLFVVLGTSALIAGELIYRNRATAVEVGPLGVTADTEKTLPMSPIFGGIVVVCGAVLIAVGVRKK